MSQATEAIAQGGSFGLRRPAELEARLWQILTKLPDAEAEWEDTYRGQLTGLLFARGMEWQDARLVALRLWDKSRELPIDPDENLAELLEPLQGRAVVQPIG